MSLRRLVGAMLLGGLGLLFALRLAWVVGHVADLRPVADGDRAPEFQLPLLGGGDFRLGAAGDHGRGRVTVIDFWATWCAPCRQELPHVDALWRRLGDRARVIAVDAEGVEASGAVAAFAQEAKLGLPIALDGSGVAERYHVSSLPHLVIVDATGHIRRVLLGIHDEDELARFVEQAER